MTTWGLKHKMLFQACTLLTLSGTVRCICESEKLVGTRRPQHRLPICNSLNVILILIGHTKLPRNSLYTPEVFGEPVMFSDGAPHRPQEEAFPTGLPPSLSSRQRRDAPFPSRQPPARDPGITGPGTQEQARVTSTSQRMPGLLATPVAGREAWN